VSKAECAVLEKTKINTVILKGINETQKVCNGLNQENLSL
jgi:molybdenum cofactor biosynthesis enzyme MoaA